MSSPNAATAPKSPIAPKRWPGWLWAFVAVGLAVAGIAVVAGIGLMATLTHAKGAAAKTLPHGWVTDVRMTKCETSATGRYMVISYTIDNRTNRSHWYRVDLAVRNNGIRIGDTSRSTRVAAGETALEETMIYLADAEATDSRCYITSVS